MIFTLFFTERNGPTSHSKVNIIMYLKREGVLTKGYELFSVLGNHDYRGNVLAQIDPALRKIDSRFICMRSFIVSAGWLTHQNPQQTLFLFSTCSN